MLRATSALVLAPVALLLCWQGGAAFLLLLALCAAALAWEWHAMAGAGHLTPAVRAAGFAYLLAACACVWRLRQAGLRDVLFLLLTVWACDIGAYFAGRAIGGRRLAPAISPGKTVSGALGGLAAAVLVGAAAARFWSAPLATCAVIGFLIGVASTVGDLGESWAKRRCGVKDSGRLIPGHGGVLDRLDGLLLAAPVLVLIEQGSRPWR